MDSNKFFLRRFSLCGFSFLVIFSFLTSGVMLQGCNKQAIGTVTGAGVGGLIGSRFGNKDTKLFYTGLGSVLGATIGSEIGKRLDKVDQLAAQETQYNALEYSNPDTANKWSNSDSGNYGEVYAGERFEQNQKTCREYTHTIYVDGKPETLRGTACKNADGSWSAA